MDVDGTESFFGPRDVVGCNDRSALETPLHHRSSRLGGDWLKYRSKSSTSAFDLGSDVGTFGIPGRSRSWVVVHEHLPRSCPAVQLGWLASRSKTSARLGLHNEAVSSGVIVKCPLTGGLFRGSGTAGRR